MQETDSHNKIDELMLSYLSGSISENDFDKLVRFSKESEDNRVYVRNILEIWFSSEVSGDISSTDKKKAYELFERRVADSRKKPKTKRLNWNVIWRAAAVIVIILLPFAGFWTGKEAVKRHFSDIVVEAPLGARTKLYLPDGTLVWLNAGSRMVYSQGFGVDDRHLKIDGEGYFEVVKNKDLPFVIDTKELELKVVGTKFNFKNYTNDSEAVVNLMEGKVILKNALKQMPDLVLSPDEKAVLDKNTGVLCKSSSIVRNSNLWTQGELFFDEEFLSDIAERLTRSFDVKIEVADSLKNKRFYGSFLVVGNSIDDVLKELSATNQMRFRLKDNTYYIY